MKRYTNEKAWLKRRLKELKEKIDEAEKRREFVLMRELIVESNKCYMNLKELIKREKDVRYF